MVAFRFRILRGLLATSTQKTPSELYRREDLSSHTSKLVDLNVDDGNPNTGVNFLCFKKRSDLEIVTRIDELLAVHFPQAFHYARRVIVGVTSRICCLSPREEEGVCGPGPGVQCSPALRNGSMEETCHNEEHQWRAVQLVNEVENSRVSTTLHNTWPN